jgi:outer membrane protein assembly factor BamB
MLHAHWLKNFFQARFAKTNFCRCVIAVIVPCSFVARATAADWPQWQGPDRNAISKETGLLQQWPEGGPALAWRINGLGGGDSAPAIAAGSIFGMSNRDDQEVVWALSEADGKELWVTSLGPAVQQRVPQSKEGPGCTPAVDGELLYVLGVGGHLACLQVLDGKLVWEKDIKKEFGGQAPMWNYRESPLIDGDKLICTPGGPDATLAALNKKTGETIWQSKLPAVENPPPAADGKGSGKRGGFGRGGFGRGGGSGAAYASPIAIDVAGQRQYVQLTSKALMGVAADDGKFLWRFDRAANGMGINCTTPIFHDGFVFASSAYGAGGALVKLSKEEGGGVQAEEVFFSNRLQNHHGGVILHEGALYGANGGNGGGYITCLDFQTGQVLWSDRKAPKGSVAFADGRIYYRVEDGTLLLIEPNKNEYVERGRFEQPDRTNVPAWAHPVIANGKLYVRDQNVLFSYDIAKK